MTARAPTSLPVFVLVCGLLTGHGSRTANAQPKPRLVAQHTEAKVPKPPDDIIYPTELVQRGASKMVRIAPTAEIPSAAELRQPLSLQVPAVRSMLGDVTAGETLTVLVDPRRPPKMKLDSTARRASRDADFLVLTADLRLLAAASENTDDSYSPRLPSAIGTSRRPSTRFNERELEWAWWAINHSSTSARRRYFELESERYNIRHDIELPPVGSIELILRFEDKDIKRILLQTMRCRELSPAAIDAARIALFDIEPEVQAEAAHLLLDNDCKVDPSLLLTALEHHNDAFMRFRLLGPLFRMNHPQARPKLLEILTDRESDESDNYRVQWYSIRGQSAYDNQNMPRYLREATLERLQSDEFSWLNEKVPAQDLKQVYGSLWWIHVVEFGPAEEWEYLTEAYAESLSGQRRDFRADSFWWYVGRLLDERLDEKSRKRAVIAVRSLRSRVGGDNRHSRARLTAVLAALGEASALDELKLMLAEGDLWSLELARMVAPIRDRRALEVLLIILKGAVNSRDPYCDGGATAGKITKLIHDRGPADSVVALAETRDWKGNPTFPRLLTRVRWALGQPPTSDELLNIDFDDPLLRLCHWNLKDHAGILPVLREKPLKHCIALAVLGDVSMAERIGQGMLQCARERGRNELDRGWMGVYRGKCAVEHLRSPDAVEPIYEAFELMESNVIEELAVTIGRIEDPNRLDRLIRLVQRSDSVEFDVDDPRRTGILKSSAALALLIALGRKR